MGLQRVRPDQAIKTCFGLPWWLSGKESACNAEDPGSILNWAANTFKIDKGLPCLGRIRLPMQGTWVWSLVQEDSTRHGATKLICHNPSTHEPIEPFAATTEAQVPRACAPQQEKPSQWEAHGPQLDRSPRFPHHATEVKSLSHVRLFSTHGL